MRFQGYLKHKSRISTVQTDDPDELCASVSPIDKFNADKPGTDYETEIGDDCEYTLFKDMKQEKV